jgi:hypothetical protein
MAGTPYGLLALLAAALALGGGLTALGVWPSGPLRALALTAGHGALLATAVAWAAPAGARTPADSRAPAIVVGAVALAMTITTVDPRAAVAYLLTPLTLAAFAAAGRLRALGVAGPVPVSGVLAGAGLGALLGAHLLFSASRSLRYHVRTDGLAAYLAAVAYDAGASVPSSELFFRGALFNRLQRRTSFSAAAAMATAATVGRYLIDPLLPKTAEVLMGTVLYVALLGVANAWLFWRTGSLLPGVASALVFFAAWRLILPS